METDIAGIVRADSGSGRLMPKSKPPAPPNFRTTILQAALDLEVESDDYERAFILAQIAGFVSKHPRMSGRVAYKGGAVMHLADQSPRLSRDLDGAESAGHEVNADWVLEALTTKEARRVIVSPGRPVRGDKNIAINYIECRTFSGGKTTVNLTIHWKERLYLPLETIQVDLPTKETLTLAVLDRRERAAEKVRAFMERGLPRDAYDLYHYNWRLERKQWDDLGWLISAKLSKSVFTEDHNLHDEFRRAMKKASSRWTDPNEMVMIKDRVSWVLVEPALEKFLKCVPQRVLGKEALRGLLDKRAPR